MSLSITKKIILATIGGAAGTAVAVPVALMNNNSGISDNKPISSSDVAKAEESSKQLSTVTVEKQTEVERSLTNVESAPEKAFDECKELGKSDLYGKLKVCRDKNDDSKVKFSWYEYLVGDSVPRAIKNLEFTHQELVVELEEEVGYGKSKRFDLTSEMFQGKGPLTIQGGSIFEEKDCKFEWILNSDKKEKMDWKAHCSLNPKIK